MHAPNQHQQFNPKVFEHCRRDKGQTVHQNISFTPLSTIPAAWLTFLGCRQCKRSVIGAIGLSNMQSAKYRLESDQTLILSGCFTGTSASTFRISGNCLPIPNSQYTSNAVEADMQIWRHVTQSRCNHILVYSPDTDVYNIGIPMVIGNTSTGYYPGECSTLKSLFLHSPG